MIEKSCLGSVLNDLCFSGVERGEDFLEANDVKFVSIMFEKCHDSLLFEVIITVCLDEGRSTEEIVGK